MAQWFRNPNTCLCLVYDDELPVGWVCVIFDFSTDSLRMAMDFATLWRRFQCENGTISSAFDRIFIRMQQFWIHNVIPTDIWNQRRRAPNSLAAGEVVRMNLPNCAAHTSHPLCASARLCVRVHSYFVCAKWTRRKNLLQICECNGKMWMANGASA